MKVDISMNFRFNHHILPFKLCSEELNPLEIHIHVIIKKGTFFDKILIDTFQLKVVMTAASLPVCKVYCNVVYISMFQFVSL